LDKIITPGAQAEKLAEGFIWSEGPVWVADIHSLLFSDVPSNAIYSWNEKEGIKLWLKPSGYSGAGFYSREPGSNGLLLDAKGRLVLCQHGNRQMARMATPVEKPSAQFEVLANTYNGKKFNSPNDAAYDDKGDLYFTDPPYGLAKQMQDSSKEIAWQGVYKVKNDGSVILLLDSLTRPNGIAFFPGHKSLLVANSDPAKAIWYRYDIAFDQLTNGTIFFDATTKDKSLRGLPDGLKIDSIGNVFASGPGGIFIFNNTGKKLGLIKLEQAASNVALSPDEKILYITYHQYLLQVKMR
jgi:gluconolactonase